jgi:hypothetical protein
MNNFRKKYLFDVENFIKEHKISNFVYRNTYNDFFLLYIKEKKFQKGGDYLANIKISSNKYNFRIDEYDVDGDKIFAIIKLDALAKNSESEDFQEDDYCAYMIIDETNKEATIQSLTNYSNCLKCVEKNINYKIGDILTQIMLITAKKKGIKKIIATDNSYMSCSNYKFQLLYLRTLTHGRPLYTKYKFIPVDKVNFEICNKNHEIFNKNPSISKKRIIVFIKKYIKKSNQEIFINYIDNLYDQIEKMSITKLILQIFLDSKKNNKLCDFLYFIYKPIYYYAGYTDYENTTFFLNLKNVNYTK